MFLIRRGFDGRDRQFLACTLNSIRKATPPAYGSTGFHYPVIAGAKFHLNSRNFPFRILIRCIIQIASRRALPRTTMNVVAKQPDDRIC